MKIYVSIVIAVVMVFLGLIIAYTMTPPNTGGAMPPAAQTH